MIDLHQCLDADHFSARRSEVEALLAGQDRQLDRFLRAIRRANEPLTVDGDLARDLRAAASFTFPGEGNDPVPLLESAELAALIQSKGSLSPKERAQMQAHVSYTFAFLSLIPWTTNLARVPEIAYMHHERQDGSGYLRGLCGDQIPIQARILAIADIYDALTSVDRPYHPGLPENEALDFLRSEAEIGRIDKDLVEVFIESAAYRSSRP